jgi:hypothetical protein
MKLGLLLLLGLLITVSTSCANNSVTVNLKVIDSKTGQPVEGAKVDMGFLISRGSNSFDGYTDGEGRVTATNTALYGVSMVIRKHGYYKSTRRTARGDQDLTLLLRPIQNPQPMYARAITLDLPAKGKKIGFDFEKGDWVIPHGKGLKAHIYFNLDGEGKDAFNYDERLLVNFPQETDGLIKLSEKSQVFESDFKFQYLASEKGYINQMEYVENSYQVKQGLRMMPVTETTFETAILGYEIRVNTEVDNEGNVIAANYGKILDEFNVSVFPKEKGGNFIKFTYYYNPIKNERSLEFDKQRNLFKGLTRQEQPKQP